MRILLDTHAILWWLADDRRLGPAARELVEDPANTIAVSMVSQWEITVKIRIGKIEADIAEILAALDQAAFPTLGIEPAHLTTLAKLPLHHRDPFDHLLIAQSIAEDMMFMTADRHAPLYPARIISC